MQSISAQATLRYLSLVDISRIPLHIITGSTLDVWTTEPETENWFSRILLDVEGLNLPDGAGAWWRTAQLESPLGILTAVDSLQDVSDGQSRISEILFFVSRGREYETRAPTPPHSSPHGGLFSSRHHATADAINCLRISAIALSSDLLYARSKHATPPASPSSVKVQSQRAVFLPTRLLHHERSGPSLAQKRKKLSDTFDEAAEHRKRTKRQGGSSVAAAAASARSLPTPKLSTTSPSSLSPGRAAGALATSVTTSVQPQPLSRSPSIASARPASKSGILPLTEPTNRSSLSLAQNTTSANANAVAIAGATLDASTIETRNRDTLSRLIMAGMRLHGLSQSKPQSKPQLKSQTKSKATQQSQPQQFQIPPSDSDADRRDAATRAQDEEYKLIYHQVLKGAVFTFRHHISSTALQLHTDVLREVVEGLLGLYCSDPLASGSVLGGVQAQEALLEEESPFRSGMGHDAAVKLLGARRLGGGDVRVVARGAEEGHVGGVG